ncbi:pentapeptide repeat-containing protein [Kordia algicida OT-1]|uniref:Peptide deformylase n=1 Tax=Kordia algicida OT-1 TaxID=391587 RepID=A9EB04_9FLAO|nr:pentapeptide repeat-containing protein [Kordia algicida]EDP94560.1 peptide deformylase [Kordia algicida OT-1]
MSGTILQKKTINYYKKKLKIEVSFFKNLDEFLNNDSSEVKTIEKDLLPNNLKFKNLVEGISYVFIFNSLIKTYCYIIANNRELFPEVNHIEKQNLIEKFEGKFENLEIEIDTNFFRNPSDSKTLKNFILLFKEWLIASKITNNQIKNITSNFERIFMLSMIQEWISRQSYYSQIESIFINSPFIDYTEERELHELYILYLTNYYISIILGDEKGMTLANLYVEPSASIFKECFTKETQKYLYHKEEVFWTLESYKSIHDIIYDFTKNTIKDKQSLENPNVNCLMILGYPGQGKTSLCYYTLYDLIESKKENSTKYYFIKLRNISETKELINNPIKIISSFIKDIHEIEFNRKDKNLVILDGLDELYMKEGLNSNDIDEFCRELGNISTLLPDTKFIVTSRYGYVNLERLKKNEFIILSLDEFDNERQQEWVDNYRIFHPESNLDLNQLDYINRNIPHVSELIRQPILLHLISKVKIDYDALSNRTDIYNKLFDSLILRKWEKKGQIENLRGLTKISLRRYIRDIALSIFQGDYEYIRKKDLEELPSTQSFLNKLEKDNLKDSLKSIMISFYFQEVKRKKTDTFEEDSSNYAIEFLHKSLQEYLVAEKIWYGFLELIDKRANGEYFIDTWQDALAYISEILSPKIISKEITEYLIELIQNEDDLQLKIDLKNRLSLYFNSFLNVHFYDTNQKSKNNIESSINTFYGFWTIFSHLDIDKNYISPQYKETFVQLLKWSLSKRHLYYNLSYQNLSHSNLNGVNFSEVSLLHTNFSHCALQGASFHRAFINKSILYNSELQRVDFSHAEIYDTNLTSCEFMNSNLSYTNFQKCNFSNSDFLKCFYLNTYFDSCDFSAVGNISKTDFYLCDKVIRPKNLSIINSIPQEKLKENNFLK